MCSVDLELAANGTWRGRGALDDYGNREVRESRFADLCARVATALIDANARSELVNECVPGFTSFVGPPLTIVACATVSSCPTNVCLLNNSETACGLRTSADV